MGQADRAGNRSLRVGGIVMAAVAAGALALALAVLAAGFAQRAEAAFGDAYGLMPINDPASGSLVVPAIPGSDYLFWAGVCDRGAAPPAGSDLAALGGIGTMPSTATSPSDSLGVGSIVEVPLLGSVRDCIDWRLGLNGTTGSTDPENLWQPPPNWRLPEATRAGAHPDGTVTFGFVNDGDTDNIVVDLPPGVVGNPNAVPKCTADQFAVKPQQCPPSTQVGVLTLRHLGAGLGGANFGGNQNVETYPVFNLEPREGNLAELGLVQLTRDGRITARLVAKARTGTDFGVTTFIGQLPGSALPITQQQITVWGVPWAPHNDVWRAPLGINGEGPCSQQPGSGSPWHMIPPGGLPAGCRQSYDPSWGPVRPFFTTETDCNPAPITRLASDVYQRPGPFTADGNPAIADYPSTGSDPAGNWKVYTTQSPPVTGCGSLPFSPQVGFTPTADAAGTPQRSADSPAGLDVDLAVPQNNDPPAAVANDPAAADAHWRSDAGRATAHLKDTVVKLPWGVAVNPSGATGLVGCEDAQMGVLDPNTSPMRFNDEDPFDDQGAECPDGSVIGTARVDTPLLEEPLLGEVVLGQPKPQDVGGPSDPLTVRLFIVVKDPARGLVAKIYGRSQTDPATGDLTARFENNPEVPFDRLQLSFRPGPRGLLRTSQRCGNHSWQSSFVPWSAAHGGGGQTVERQGAFEIQANCEFGFAPDLAAGMDNRAGGSFGGFSFEFSRNDGEQWIGGLTARLPEGLLAAVRDVPLCTNAQAAANACPPGSRIGWVDAAAGAGDPFVLERKGDVYLTESYKGAPYGLAVSVPVEAGPFRGPVALAPIVVRQQIQVDPNDASVTAVSDPLPTIWHGIPLAIRRVLVKIDRNRFTINPTSCAPKQIGAIFNSNLATVTSATTPFQATNCRRLAFKPKLRMRLTGRKQTKTGRHPGIRARVTQRRGEAAVKRAVVRLPKTLALDVRNAQALCEFDQGTRPDLENHCPKGSIVGRARAVSPLLKRPLKGNVYFVKNIRIDKDTGNEIRTLPMIIAALRGEVAVNLRGNSSVGKGGKLISTFANVPDAPIRRFNLNIRGGKTGIIAVTRKRRAGAINICNSRQIAVTNFDGQNARRHDRNLKIKTPPCNKPKKRR
ncbi:MAG TPA: hypothetical protein VHH53_13465 [Pseudonocardiaceae bacterium]|nr:hypothetical protein [Pseudonocardiaceae bacterium]